MDACTGTFLLRGGGWLQNESGLDLKKKCRDAEQLNVQLVLGYLEMFRSSLPDAG